MGEIPYGAKGPFWISFESDPRLKKTKSNIYERCLPCIRNLYEQLQQGCSEIKLGSAYDCWKITVVLESIGQCILLLMQFEEKFPTGHVYGKIGTSRPNSNRKAVVFHTDKKAERDRIQKALEICLMNMDLNPDVLISRGCAVLYNNLLGDWYEWSPVTPIRFPEKVSEQLAYIKRLLFRSSM